jgi:16S rRNA (guanine1207-N2)-methyltransferase
MLTPQSQLILRNQADLTGKVLLIEPMADDLARELAYADSSLQLFCFTTDKSVATQWQAQSTAPCYFAADLAATDLAGTDAASAVVFDTVVLFYPKSKEQLGITLAQLGAFINADSQIYLVGDNKGGIKSLVSHAEKLGLGAHKLDNAKHCLWFALNDLAAKPLPKVAMQQFTCAVPPIGEVNSLKFCSLPGVFNHGKLDAGTLLLLENVKHIQQGRVLDFACGAGIVGSYLLKAQPALQLFSSDVSALAVASSKATFALNQQQATVLAADGLPNGTPLFDHIVSNPPFHTGLKTDYSVAQKFIDESKAKLSSSGTLTLVANAHLPYADWLKAAFGNVKELARRQGFVVYFCRKG